MQMAKINYPTTTIILDKRYQRADKTYPIKLRVTFRQKQFYYPTNINLTEQDYERMNGTRPRLAFQEIKRKANEEKFRADDIIQELRGFSIQAFNARFLAPKNLTTDLSSLFKAYWEKLQADGKAEGTIALYKTTLASITRFHPGCQITDITVGWLKKYETWMLVENSNSTTILSIYLRNVRSVMNRAITVEKVMEQEFYPFGKYGYSIPEGKNEKQALDFDQVERIFKYKPPIPSKDDKKLERERKEKIRKTRAIFCFSYLAAGMNLKDIALLRIGDITKDTISYYRAKTSSRRKKPQPIKVHLTSKIQAILKRFAIRNSYIHCDAALAGTYLALLGSANFDFNHGCDSIAISGHKFIGSPIPCGVILVKKHYKDRVGKAIPYIGTLDTTISGSRNAIAPLFLWYAIQKFGKEGLIKRAEDCLANALFLTKELNNLGLTVWRNQDALTVVMPKPSPSICSKWSLATEQDIAHVICMPGITREILKLFIVDIKTSLIPSGYQYPILS